MRSFAIVLLVTTFFKLEAQNFCSPYDAFSTSGQNVFAVGENSIIAGYQDKKELFLTKYDSTTNVVWNKNYELFGKEWGENYLFHNENGNDIYVLSFDDIKSDGGGSGLTIAHIDGVTGESKKKFYAGDGFGHVLDYWASDKYFFVRTTQYKLSDEKIIKSPKSKLYRFDKNLGMQTLSHEMDNASGFARVYWTIVRVENDFFEGYVVNEAGNKISLTLARFDNEGKKIRTANSEFRLSDDTYTRQIDMKGISHIPMGDVVLLVYPTSTLNISYCKASKSYFAYGLCGPGEQKQLATIYSGFFVAKMDSAFSHLIFKEHTDIPELKKDADFRIHLSPLSRFIYFYTYSNEELFISVPGFRYTMDQNTLELKESTGNYCLYKNTNEKLKTENSITDDPAVKKSIKSPRIQCNLVNTTRWQFAFAQNFATKEGHVYVSKI